MGSHDVAQELDRVLTRLALTEDDKLEQASGVPSVSCVA
jgi:hypothetical protein